MGKRLYDKTELPGSYWACDVAKLIRHGKWAKLWSYLLALNLVLAVLAVCLWPDRGYFLLTVVGPFLGLTFSAMEAGPSRYHLRDKVVWQTAAATAWLELSREYLNVDSLPLSREEKRGLQMELEGHILLHQMAAYREAGLLIDDDSKTYLIDSCRQRMRQHTSSLEEQLRAEGELGDEPPNHLPHKA